MAIEDTKAEVDWAPGDVPVSRRYGDSYYARTDGLAESRHVFLEGNALRQRFAEARAFHIAELGFGTGLNAAAAVALWQQSAPRGARLTFTSFEAAPMAEADRAQALGRWPESAALLADVMADRVPGVDVRLVVGDARVQVPLWSGMADAWFLDGFAPDRNPEMWEPDLMAAVFARTRPGGSFATYSAAGRVRRALQAAGFDVHRLPGFGRKREMLAGEKR